MNRICLTKDGKLIEMQSGGDDREDLMEMRLNTLKQNAINAGYKEDDIEVKWVTDVGYEAAKAVDPQWIAEQQAIADKEAAQAAKAQAFIDNLPSWAQVDQAVTDISDLPSAKAFIRKLARVVYGLVRDN